MTKIKNEMVEILKSIVLSAIAMVVFLLAASGALILFGLNGVAVLVLLIVIFVVIIDNSTDKRAK